MCKRTVLVIEDADATRRLVELSLSLEGFNVVQRADGLSGFDAAMELLPDVVVLDVALPGIDGWEVLQRIRADARSRAIPVVMVTAHDTAEARNQAMVAEADAFLGKPFDVNHLRRVVANLVRDES
jgi:two-component system cell cycle response regulator